MSPVLRTHIAKWGNSLGLRLPKVVAESLALEPGTLIEFELQPGRIVLALARPHYELRTLVARISEKNRPRIEADPPTGAELL
jgi:antitoxin MazE